MRGAGKDDNVTQLRTIRAAPFISDYFANSHTHREMPALQTATRALIRNLHCGANVSNIAVSFRPRSQYGRFIKQKWRGDRAIFIPTNVD
jgi:hypothetical protein